jgi:hypothetical protein
MLWRRNQAMFYTAIATDLILVGTGMKEPYIQRFSIVYLRKEYFVDVFSES